jgi:holo-[acyl-carrier protein] synthase
VDIVGIGIDICDVNRVRRALGRHPTFAERVFTEEERAYCEQGGTPAECYAGRFAVREAVIKALGGYVGKKWQDVSVSRGPSGAPAVRLAGSAKARADMLGIENVFVSFTHERDTAVAFVVAVGA